MEALGAALGAWLSSGWAAAVAHWDWLVAIVGGWLSHQVVWQKFVAWLKSKTAK